MDLATRIRTELAEGKPPERIVDDLVASGMSRPTAQRIVDRAVASPALPPASAAPPSSSDSNTADEADGDPGGKWALVRGAFSFSAGLTITALTYYLAKPGQKYTVMYGLVVAGAVAFWRGLVRWSNDEHATFPAMLLLAAVALPMLAGGSVAWYRREPTERERIIQALEKAESEADAKLKEEAAQRKQQEVAERTRIDLAMIDSRKTVEASQLLIDARPAVRCQGAQFFADRKKPDMDSNLMELVERDPDMNVRRCGIDALAATGSASALLIVLNKLAQYEDYRPLVVHGLSKMTTDLTDDQRNLMARVQAKLDAAPPR